MKVEHQLPEAMDENVLPASSRSPVDEPISNRKSRFANRLRRFLRYCLAAAFVSYVTLIHIVPRFISLPYHLTHAPPPGLQFTDRDGAPLRHFLSDDELRRDPPAKLEEIPQSLIDATLAAEDTRFYTHNGIDYFGVMRAARDAAIHRKVVSGASTVSQQLIKISSIPRARNLKTKVIEALSARRLEQLWEKDDILVAYLNRLPYGNQLTGCRAAARGYFSKPLADLSVAESAFLAGLPNKPSRFNPHKNFTGAQERQRYVLRRMREEEMLTDSQYQSALNEPIRLIARARSPFRAPHLVELARADTDPGLVASEQTLRTTLDGTVQHFAEQTLETQLRRLDKITGNRNVQGAAVVIDNATGDVLALAGSRDFFASPGGQINGAWTPRSPGSALKPFTYLVALENGHTAASILPDIPIEYATPTGAYRPVNFDRRTSGPVTLRHALANSLNIPAVRLLDDIGGPSVLHETLQTLGLTTLAPDPATYGLGLTLGTAEVRLLELTNAYATIARLGDHLPCRLTLDGTFADDSQRPDSSIQDRSQGPSSRLFSPDACYLIADILSDNRARASAFGLSSPLHFSAQEIPNLRVAVKTGTSTDFRDNWCVGFTPDFTVGVWVGRFDNSPLKNISGVSGAGPIFHDLMVHLHQHPDRPPHWYRRPATFVDATIDALNGKRVAGIVSPPPSTRREVFRSSHHLPELATPADYESISGRTYLPGLYASWMKTNGHFLRSRAAISPEESREKITFRILSPVEGTTAYLDPDLPDHGRFFPLEISGSAERVQWQSDTLAIDDSNPASPLAVLTPGSHRITATDTATGAHMTVEFVVDQL